jgi:ABC-type glycerol-3-phosphate transport system substrate-binding protein
MMRTTLGRRQFLQWMGGMTSGVLLAGCAPGAAPGAQAPAAQPAAGGAESAPQVLEFWDWDHEPRVIFLNQLVDEFQSQNPGIQLKYNPLGWTDIETKLMTVATAGSGPIFSNVHFFWRYDLQRAGVLAPYPEDMFNWDQLLSTPFNRDPETGHVYTCDFNFYCDQVYFNQELLEAEGIDPADIPRNWDDFLAMAQQLSKKDAGGNTQQVGCSLNDYWSQEWLWHTLVYQQGGWLYNESGTEALWNSEEGVRALQFIKDWYHRYEIDDPEFLGQGDAFGNGRAAMYINQGYSAAGINMSFPQMEGKWSTVETPTFSGTPDPSWGMAVPEEGFCVFNTFDPEMVENSFRFIEYALGSDERRLEWALLMDGPPDRIDLLDHPSIEQEDTGRSIETQASTMPWRVIYGERPLEAEKFWRTMFDEVILGNEEPKAVLDRATEQINVALRESGTRRLIVERNYQPPS